mmetsp:Transcript_7705/g.12290  ORF Transcript_7705/g.12290 Transcript_7705/m.12290 type:complete len:200 (+) Transcript_7705:3756-4355(+)
MRSFSFECCTCRSWKYRVLNPLSAFTPPRFESQPFFNGLASRRSMLADRQASIRAAFSIFFPLSTRTSSCGMCSMNRFCFFSLIRMSENSFTSRPTSVFAKVKYFKNLSTPHVQILSSGVRIILRPMILASWWAVKCWTWSSFIPSSCCMYRATLPSVLLTKKYRILCVLDLFVSCLLRAVREALRSSVLSFAFTSTSS